MAHIRIQVDGPLLTFEILPQRERKGDIEVLDELKGTLAKYLREESPSWEGNEWKRMLGISKKPAPWYERVLLLCRVQHELQGVSNSEEKELLRKHREKFVMLPDGMVFSMRSSCATKG